MRITSCTLAAPAIIRALVIAAACAAMSAGAGLAQERLRVVTTLPTYAAIAREIAGDMAEVTAIARGDEDVHFVNPRPSFARLLQSADLFVSTGLDLELWVPGLMERANNPRVVEGADGHVVAYAGIDLLDIPESASRVGGDVHVFGNPHVHTDPINGIQIGRNILAGLKRVDPQNGPRYEIRMVDFEDRLLARVFGDRLVEMLGKEVLLSLARSRGFWSFAGGQTFDGRQLTEYVGGWLELGLPFRGKRMACYHKNWAYFSARFDVECAIYVERKPGIPPSPGHVGEVIAFIEDNGIPVLFAANYFPRRQVEQVATRAGARALIVPEHVDGAPEVATYFELIDSWVSCLAAAFGGNVPPCRR
ncbi:MAG: metal ABC transporter substrate-binding protein [Gemmatimonadota bacterium]|nr:metal ABC transporter substrate-binding protein [Gemmatimonadota bacterium]